MAGFAHYPDELTSFLAFMWRIESEFRAGATLSEILSRYELTPEQFSSLCDRYAGPVADGSVLDRSPVLNAVVPVFHMLKGDELVQHVGSGVLIKIDSFVFVLTAGHVAVGCESGTLFVPGTDALTALAGGVSYNHQALGKDRHNDVVDMGYIRLDETVASSIHPSFLPIGLDDLDPADSVERVPFATFVGYPCSKSRVRGAVHQTERVTYTGHVWSADVYQQLGYCRSNHICIRMRLKRTYSSLFKKKTIAPRPGGVSGGAIVAWPATYVERESNPRLRLIGIAHTYDRPKNCLAGTHVMPFLYGIAKNNPALCPTIEDLAEARKRFHQSI